MKNSELILALPPGTAGVPPATSRSGLSVTAEEKGLLGSRYFAQNPLYPLNRTVAVINMDGANQFGRTSDLEVIGFGVAP